MLGVDTFVGRAGLSLATETNILTADNCIVTGSALLDNTACAAGDVQLLGSHV